MSIDISAKEIWFVTGSQHLYGEETLRQVANNAQEITRGLDGWIQTYSCENH